MSEILSGDDRFSKLPKWVQDRAMMLESKLRIAEEANRKLRGDYSQTNGESVVLDPYGIKTPIGDHAVVRFYLNKNEHDWIDVRLDRRMKSNGTSVQVSSSDALVVLPRSTNGLSIENRSFFS